MFLDIDSFRPRTSESISEVLPGLQMAVELHFSTCIPSESENLGRPSSHKNNMEFHFSTRIPSESETRTTPAKNCNIQICVNLGIPLLVGGKPICISPSACTSTSICINSFVCTSNSVCISISVCMSASVCIGVSVCIKTCVRVYKQTVLCGVPPTVAKNKSISACKQCLFSVLICLEMDSFGPQASKSISDGIQAGSELHFSMRIAAESANPEAKLPREQYGVSLFHAYIVKK